MAYHFRSKRPIIESFGAGREEVLAPRFDGYLPEPEELVDLFDGLAQVPARALTDPEGKEDGVTRVDVDARFYIHHFARDDAHDDVQLVLIEGEATEHIVERLAGRPLPDLPQNEVILQRGVFPPSGVRRFVEGQPFPTDRSIDHGDFQGR